MTTFTTTSIGLTAPGTAATNSAALSSWAGSAGTGHTLKVDGTFNINANTNLQLPASTIIEAATPGSTTQGFDIRNSSNASSAHALRLGAGSTLRGLTFTAPDAPANQNNPTGTNPDHPTDLHRVRGVEITDNCTVEYNKFTGSLGIWVDLKNGNCDNAVIRRNEFHGGEYQINTWDAKDTEISYNYHHHALRDCTKLNFTGTFGVTERTNIHHNYYYRAAADALDTAGNVEDLNFDDNIVIDANVAGIDSKTDIEPEYVVGVTVRLNKNFSISRTIFIDCQSCLAVGEINSEGTNNISRYEHFACQEIYFYDCITARTGDEPTTPFQRDSGRFFLKGGMGIYVYRHAFHGGTAEGFDYDNSFGYWPSGWSPSTSSLPPEFREGTTTVPGLYTIPEIPFTYGPSAWTAAPLQRRPALATSGFVLLNTGGVPLIGGFS